MKKILVLIILILLTPYVQAQWYTQKYGVNNINDLNQKQLEFSLSKAEKNIKTGKILTFTGLGAFAVGTIIGVHSVTGMVNNDIDDQMSEFAAGSILMMGGIICTTTGIPIWAVNANRRNKIEVALVNFSTTSYLGYKNSENLRIKQHTIYGLRCKIIF